MGALFMIDTFGVSAIEVGFVSLSMAVVYIFTNVLPFNFLAKRIGIYITCLVGCAILCISMLMTAITYSVNIWVYLFFLVFGFGSGYGLLMPAVAAMGADFTNELNRGKILGMVAVSNHISIVIGPLLHGFLYEINVLYPFYIASIFIFFGLCVILVVLFKYPWTTIGKCDCLRNQRITHLLNSNISTNYKRRIPLNTDFINLENIGKNGIGEWTFVADAVNDEQYLQLGKDLGELLSKRNYQWVTWRQELLEYFDDNFPVLPITSKDEFLAHVNYFFRGDDENELVADLEYLAL